MRIIVLALLVSLLMGCLSLPREREAHCLAATMTDLWEAEQQLTAAEHAWRRAQLASVQRSIEPALPQRIADRDAPPPAAMHAGVRGDDFRHLTFETEEKSMLYGSIVSARSRRAHASRWLDLVARRVQTRIEEDDMLYPVLGMLATSTAIILYPLVRWNVRSVLWDGVDPDAEDDPVQRFCAARLGESVSSPP
jgi:hypothetical protein